MQQAIHDQLTPEGLIRLLVLRRWIIAGVTVAGTLAALLVAVLSTPIYRAEVLLAPVSSNAEGGLPGLSGQLGGLASLAGVSLGNAGGDQAEAVATLKSRALTTSLIEERNLLPILYAGRWDASQKRWKSEGARNVPTIWEAQRLFAKNVRQVVEDKKTGLVIVAIEWTEPKLTAEWANDLVLRTNRILRKRAIERSQANIAFLKQQLEQSSIIELRQAIYRLLEGEIKKTMLAQGNEEYAFKVIDPAVVPEKKEKPHRTLIVVVGSAGSLFAACFAALLLPPPRKRLG